jgi:hypothetical protein
MGSGLSGKHETGMDLFFRKQHHSRRKKLRLYKRVVRPVYFAADQASRGSTVDISAMQHFTVSMGE